MKTLVIGLILSVSTQSMASNDIFSKMKPNEARCYGREYSSKHLKSNPQQTVQKIQTKFYQLSNYDTRLMEMEVTLRGEKNTHKNYRAFFICNTENNYCGIECDGGRVEVSLNKSGKVVIKNEGFVLSGGCGSEESGDGDVFLKSLPKGDDLFELVPLPKSFCQITD